MIRIEEIDGEQRCITECGKCVFLNEGCELNKLPIFSQRGLVQRGKDLDPEILTLCRFGRDEKWLNGVEDKFAQVEEETRFGYDLIIRYENHDSIYWVKKLKIKPRNLIISYTDKSVLDAVKTFDVGIPFEVLISFDPETRIYAETDKVKSTYCAFAFDEFDDKSDIFEGKLNKELMPLVALTRKDLNGSYIMKQLIRNMKSVNMEICVENVNKLCENHPNTLVRIE